MICEKCGKGSAQRNSVSHAKNKFVRYAKANLKHVRVMTKSGIRQLWVCTKCLKTGRVISALPRRISRPAAVKAA